MSGTLFQIAPLENCHDRAGFHSGSESLDRYFRDQVMQDPPCWPMPWSAPCAPKSPPMPWWLTPRMNPAAAFYQHHGFIRLPDQALKLF